MSYLKCTICDFQKSYSVALGSKIEFTPFPPALKSKINTAICNKCENVTHWFMGDGAFVSADSHRENFEDIKWRKQQIKNYENSINESKNEINEIEKLHFFKRLKKSSILKKKKQELKTNKRDLQSVLRYLREDESKFNLNTKLLGEAISFYDNLKPKPKCLLCGNDNFEANPKHLNCGGELYIEKRSLRYNMSNEELSKTHRSYYDERGNIIDINSDEFKKFAKKYINNEMEKLLNKKRRKR